MLIVDIPSLNFSVMAVPGAIAGILWSTGNLFSIYAVLVLGEAVAYPALQTSLVISGLWGIIYYKELKGKYIVVFIFFALVCCVGMVLLYLGK